MEDPTSFLFAAMTKIAKKVVSTEVVAVNSGPCDKCDGPHDASRCPHFKGKQRDTHKDATDMYSNSNTSSAKQTSSSHATAAAVDVSLSASNARVVPQPGDGSCLFHSLAYGLRKVYLSVNSSSRSSTSSANSNCKLSTNATDLRMSLENYIASHPSEIIGGTAISDWVLWDSQVGVTAYADRMRVGSDWGGAIEIAVCALLMAVEVHVYERKGTSFTIISKFESSAAVVPLQDVVHTNNNESNESGRTVKIVYGGRCHYDAIEVIAV